jgi:hypothetical protein
MSRQMFSVVKFSQKSSKLHDNTTLVFASTENQTPAYFIQNSPSSATLSPISARSLLVSDCHSREESLHAPFHSFVPLFREFNEGNDK